MKKSVRMFFWKNLIVYSLYATFRRECVVTDDWNVFFFHFSRYILFPLMWNKLINFLNENPKFASRVDAQPQIEQILLFELVCLEPCFILESAERRYSWVTQAGFFFRVNVRSRRLILECWVSWGPRDVTVSQTPPSLFTIYTPTSPRSSSLPAPPRGPLQKFRMFFSWSSTLTANTSDLHVTHPKPPPVVLLSTHLQNHQSCGFDRLD